MTNPLPPKPGEFCDRHWSWLCQADRGQCQREHKAAATPSTAPACVAHGNAACEQCSQITVAHLEDDGGCTGCTSYGSTGMHWDTCPGRVRGTRPFATRTEALAYLAELSSGVRP